MSILWQNMIALGLTAVCVAAVVWQIVRTFRGKAGAGSCCSNGCAPEQALKEGGIDHKSLSRTVFLSSDSLRGASKK